MYPRVKRVHRGDQVYEYVQLVTGERVDGKVRQRVVATLGRLDELKASGQLDRWAGAFTLLDLPPVGTRREVGALLLVERRRLRRSEPVSRSWWPMTRTERTKATSSWRRRRPRRSGWPGPSATPRFTSARRCLSPVRIAWDCR